MATILSIGFWAIGIGKHRQVKGTRRQNATPIIYGKEGTEGIVANLDLNPHGQEIVANLFSRRRSQWIICRRYKANTEWLTMLRQQPLGVGKPASLCQQRSGGMYIILARVDAGIVDR